MKKKKSYEMSIIYIFQSVKHVSSAGEFYSHLQYVFNFHFLTLCLLHGCNGYEMQHNISEYAVKPVLRGHLWDKEKVVFQDS
jgi:maltodextrin utilization protein YvdJ